MKKRIAILGAGPAGLSLAFNLLKKQNNDFEVIIFDRESVTGGISASFSK
ncbi:MAG: NAD(P)-binding protein, partial [Clostridiaceae bacterium]|nr:NAD(P)-binding protein [Clostridiaceae bacterium]